MKNPAAVALGSIKSPKKALAARLNGAKGGRPKKEKANVTIEKHWDGNVCETEANGRIYTSNGRWQWVVVVDGEAESAHDLKRDAVFRAKQITDHRLEQ